MAGRTAFFIGLAAMLPGLPVLAHRPLLAGTSCSPTLSTPDTALEVPDISISWAMNRIHTCSSGNRAMWLKWKNPQENMKIYIGVGVETIKRFDLVRADFLVVGPGLPKLTDGNKSKIPAEILTQVNSIPHSSTFGGVLHQSPDNQSSCAHICDAMKKSTTVRMGRCDFHEPYTDTHSWRVVDVDDIFGVNLLATYYVAVWLRPDTSSKFGVAIGTWKEDFVTNYPLGNVSQCAADSGDFAEKKTLSKDDPVKYETCNSSATAPSWMAQWSGPDECGTASTFTTSMCPLTQGGTCEDDDAAVEKAAGQWGMTKCDASLCTGQYKDMMAPLCKKTCGLCSAKKCEDDNAQLEQVAGKWGIKECAASLCKGQYKDMISPMCKKTCGLCGSDPTTTTAAPTTTSTTKGAAATATAKADSDAVSSADGLLVRSWSTFTIFLVFLMPCMTFRLY